MDYHGHKQIERQRCLGVYWKNLQLVRAPLSTEPDQNHLGTKGVSLWFGLHGAQQAADPPKPTWHKLTTAITPRRGVLE